MSDMSNPDLDNWARVEDDEEPTQTVGDDVDGTTLNAVDEDDEFGIAIPARTSKYASYLDTWISSAF